MLPDRVSNPGPLTYESGVLPIALRGPVNKGCHTCMIKHTMHVQSLHCSAYLTWLDVCIYVPRSHFHVLKRLLGKGQLRTA